VLEDLGRREVPVLLAAALHLLILLDPVEDLPQVAWVVGARNGSFLGPIPVRATISLLTVTTAPLSVLPVGSTRARVPPSGVPGTWSS
jgi:hypothetical protein